MKHSFIAIICFFAIPPCNSQDQVGKSIADHLLIKAADKDRYGEPEEETIGSPYLEDIFISGAVHTFNESYNDLPMRYNIYSDYIEFKQNGQIFILDPEPRLKSVHLGDKTFVVLKHEFKGKWKHGYLELLDTGKALLLVKKTMLYHESQPAKALESSATPAKYTRMPDIYFYKIGSGEVAKVGNIKNLIERFPDKHAELTEFSKREKLGVKQEADLKKLFNYYNSL